jgi:uncharacterized protein VirK/YbjX
MHDTFSALLGASKILFPKGRWRRPRVLARLWIHGLLNYRLLREARRDAGPGNLNQRPANAYEFWATLVWPLVDARWGAGRRLQEALLHDRTATRLGSLLDLQMDEVRSVLQLDALCDTLELCLERRSWFSHEGRTTLSLFYAAQRVYSLTFLLSTKEGKRVAYVGAIQGAKQSEDSDAHKIMTKAAHGMRPRDLTIAMFQMLCQAMQIEQILAVRDQNRHHEHPYFGTGGNPLVFADYDAIWSENGGVLQPDGLYLLAPGVRRKDLAEVSSKKRSMYRKREEFLEQCQQSLNALVTSCLTPRHRALPEPARNPSATAQAPAVSRKKTAAAWLGRMRPTLWGSWLWSFPEIFM